GFDDAPLPHDALVARCRSAGRGNTHRAVHIAAAQLVDLVLASARDVPVLEGCYHSEGLCIRPAAQLLLVGDLGHVSDRPVGGLAGGTHRFPTSSSRYSAYLARAASCFFGSHSD